MSRKTNFKVGDKVKIRQWEDMEKEFGTDSNGDIKCKRFFTNGMKHLCGRIATITHIDWHDLGLCFEDKTGGIAWNYSTDMVEHLKNETIVIYRKDNEVFALDKCTGKKAVAKCSPKDKFDFETGAKLAFERLFEEEKPKFLSRFEYGKTYIFDRETYFKSGGASVSDWPSDCDGKTVDVIGIREGKCGVYGIEPEWCIESPYYNGKVVCVDTKINSHLYTKGKIYQFKNGFLTDDNGKTYPDDEHRCVTFSDFERWTSSKFVELVE